MTKLIDLAMLVVFLTACAAAMGCGEAGTPGNLQVFRPTGSYQIDITSGPLQGRSFGCFLVVDGIHCEETSRLELSADGSFQLEVRGGFMDGARLGCFLAEVPVP